MLEARHALVVDHELARVHGTLHDGVAPLHLTEELLAREEVVGHLFEDGQLERSAHLHRQGRPVEHDLPIVEDRSRFERGHARVDGIDVPVALLGKRRIEAPAQLLDLFVGQTAAGADQPVVVRAQDAELELGIARQEVGIRHHAAQRLAVGEVLDAMQAAEGVELRQKLDVRRARGGKDLRRAQVLVGLDVVVGLSERLLDEIDVFRRPER